MHQSHARVAAADIQAGVAINFLGPSTAARAIARDPREGAHTIHIGQPYTVSLTGRKGCRHTLTMHTSTPVAHPPEAT